MLVSFGLRSVLARQWGRQQTSRALADPYTDSFASFITFWRGVLVDDVWRPQSCGERAER